MFGSAITYHDKNHGGRIAERGITEGNLEPNQMWDRTSWRRGNHGGKNVEEAPLLRNHGGIVQKNHRGIMEEES